MPDPRVAFYEALQRLIAPYPKEDLGGDLPPVAHPPQFRPSTTVVGSPELAQEVERLLRFMPELRGRADRVTQGPTRGSIEEAIDRGKDPTQGYPAGLGGITIHQPHGTGADVSIDPSFHGDQLRNTLAHEIAHTAGVGEDWAYPIGDAWEQLRYEAMKKALVK
jgi:hypothetical protein